MADFKLKYGTTTDLAMNLGALADAAAYESTVVDNETNLFVDAFVNASLKNHETSAPTGEKACHVYVYAGLDDTEPTTDGTDGTEGTITLGDVAHFSRLGSVYFSAAAQTRDGGPWSVADAFGGSLPAKWGVLILNKTGFALDATDGDHVCKYRGVTYQSV